MLIFGQCQCGNISLSIQWTPDPTEIPARECTCSFCQAHRCVWTSSPWAKLNVEILNTNQLYRHSFATRTANFFICTQCEDVPLVTSEIDGIIYAVVNVNTLRRISPKLFKHSFADFDGESLDEKIARRRERWIPDVIITNVSSG